MAQTTAGPPAVPPKPREEDPQKPERIGLGDDTKPAGKSALSLAALTTVLTAAGITDGVIGRMIGEAKWWFIVAAALTLGAGFVGLIASLWCTKDGKPERGFIAASNFMLLIGLVVGIVGATQTWSNTRAPTVSATPSSEGGTTKVKVGVKSSGLDSTEHVKLVVERLVRLPENDAQGNERRVFRATGGPIYSAWLGSEEDGKLAHDVTVEMPRGFTGLVGARAFVGRPSGDCYVDPGEGDSCVTLDLPNEPERLQLSANWNADHTQLAGTLKATHVKMDNTVHLRAVGQIRDEKRTRRLLERWQLAPDRNGTFERSFTIGKIGRFTWVCVLAATERLHKCPPPERATGAEVVWARYRVPKD